MHTPDPWDALRSVTSARIALGRAGGSLPTRELLDFERAHAEARDAVHAEFDTTSLAVSLSGLGVEVQVVESAAETRELFLRRPDLGRRLSERARHELEAAARDRTPCDLAILIADGLSATAAQSQSVPLLEKLLPLLAADRWNLCPLTLVRFGRVAIEDEIGELWQARLALILIGERPGLGSADSLGAYLVFDPQEGRTDAERNCVSNIRPAGLTPEAAAATLHYLLTESRTRRLSGVHLKDDRALPGSSRPAAGLAVDSPQETRGG